MLKSLTFVIVLLAVLIFFGFNYKSIFTKVKKPSELHSKYDYVIIGAGSAGCVLAARLSEIHDATVLLIEAGAEEHVPFYSHVPGATPYLQQTVLDWQFFSVPQTKCCDSMKGNQARWPRGKVLGGSSVLNYMHYVRGNPLDYDHWAEMGNTGWSYQDVLPYFKKAESIMVDHLKTSEFHGTDGPLVITESLPTRLGDVFAEALRGLGYPINTDFNGAQQEGFARNQFNIYNGKRESTASVYLRPVINRENLHVLTKAHVSRILFDDHSSEKRASGVEYMHDGKTHKVFASKEVILSAGAIGSPHILMLSGVGPEDQLDKYGIHKHVSLPAVGQNMLDHIGVIYRYSMNESLGVDLSEMLNSYSVLASSTFEYLFNGSGPLTLSPLEYVGFLRSGLVDTRVPELQFYLGADMFVGEMPNLMNLDAETVKAVQVNEPGKFAFSLITLILHPRSVGEIRLQSSDPKVPPLIDPKNFHNELDLDIMVDGLNFLDRVAQTPQMQNYQVKHYEDPIPSCLNFPQWSQDYVRCLARSRPITIYHPVSTCRMGNSHENNVVDPELRVYGIKGLRVVDASVFPDQISGNPNAPIIMLAEKAADLIKNSK